MAITTSGFQLSALPQPLQVPGNLGVLKPPLDAQEILALAQQHLSALNQARQASVQQEQLGMERQRLASETAARQSALASEAQQRQQRGQLFPSQLQTAQQTAQRGALELPVYQSKAALDLAQNRFALGGVGPQETVSTFSETPSGTYVQEEVNRVGNNVLSRKSVETPRPPGVKVSDIQGKPISAYEIGTFAPHPARLTYNGVIIDPATGEPIDQTRYTLTGPSRQQLDEIENKKKLTQAEDAARIKRENEILILGPKAKRALDSAEANNLVLQNNIMDAITLAKGLTTTGPVGQVFALGPFDARTLRNKIEAIKASNTLAALTELRNSSPRGGALGNVSNKDLTVLASKIAVLDQNASEASIIEALKDISNYFNDSLQRAREDYATDFSSTQATEQPAQTIPTLSPDEAAKLPSGAQFRGSDGVIYTKH